MGCFPPASTCWFPRVLLDQSLLFPTLLTTRYALLCLSAFASLALALFCSALRSQLSCRRRRRRNILAIPLIVTNETIDGVRTNVDVRDIPTEDAKVLESVLNGTISAVSLIVEKINEKFLICASFCYLLLTQHLFSVPQHHRGYRGGFNSHPRRGQGYPRLRDYGRQGAL